MLYRTSIDNSKRKKVYYNFMKKTFIIFFYIIDLILEFLF